MSVTIPRGNTRLDALYAAEAERLAHEFSRVCEHHPIGSTGYENDAHEALLRNLSRPASRDFAVRVGADLEQAAVYAGARYQPNAEILGWWLALRDNPESLLAALLAVAS